MFAARRYGENPVVLTSDHYLPTLDGWRALAIAMVVLSHCLTTASASNGSGGSVNLLTFRLGTFGVMLFFAISGFLICTRLLIEEEKTGSVSLRSFYIRRVFRILPPAYAYLAVVVLLAAAGILRLGRTDIAGAAFFFSNYVPSESGFTGHFWSLAIEEHFYLFWPPILVVLGRMRGLWAGGSLILLTIFLRHQATGRAPDGADLQGYTQLRLDAFMFPCILAILLRDRPWAKRFTDTMTAPVWCFILLALGAGIAVGAAVPAWREPQRVVQSALLPLIIVTTVMRPGDWFALQLRRPWIEWLGRISYSVYLWQQLVFGFAPPNGLARILALPLLVLLILFLAALSYRCIEKPLIAVGKRMASRVIQREIEGQRDFPFA
jgi:peptidoglycan/LPS O-acetylase OafA/YrhL